MERRPVVTMGGNGWGLLNNIVDQIFSFLKSKNFLIVLALVAIFLGIVNFEQIKDLLETIKGFLK